VGESVGGATAITVERFASGAAGSVNSNAPATLDAAKAWRIARNVTFLDYPGPIDVSQGRSDVYPGPPMTLIVLRSMAALLSLRFTVARTSNSPAGRSFTMNK